MKSYYGHSPLAGSVIGNWLVVGSSALLVSGWLLVVSGWLLVVGGWW
ncbi:MAG: hypothetical protein ACHBN1_27115 [Heteroscytonema crispum UTEX LB 1556]